MGHLSLGVRCPSFSRQWNLASWLPPTPLMDPHPDIGVKQHKYPSYALACTYSVGTTTTCCCCCRCRYYCCCCLLLTIIIIFKDALIVRWKALFWSHVSSLSNQLLVLSRFLWCPTSDWFFWFNGDKWLSHSIHSVTRTTTLHVHAVFVFLVVFCRDNNGTHPGKIFVTFRCRF